MPVQVGKAVIYSQGEVQQLCALQSLELCGAGAEVLRDAFGFSEEQIDSWLERVVERANARRARAKAVPGAQGGVCT